MGCDPIIDGIAGGGCNILDEVLTRNERCFVSDEDFLGNLSTNLTTQQGYNLVNGGGYTSANQAPASGDTTHFGILRSTLAPGGTGGSYRQINDSIAANCFGNSNRLAWACRFRLSGVAPSAGEDYFASMGIESQEAALAEALNGIYFYLDRNNANWLCKAVRGAVRTTLDCGVGFDTNWHTAGFITAADALSVSVFFDGAFVGTITPANLNPSLSIESTTSHLKILSAITQNALFDCDRVIWGVSYG